MKKTSIFGIASLLLCGVFACSKGASYPRTPTATVKACFSGMGKIRAAAKAAKAEGATEKADDSTRADPRRDASGEEDAVLTIGEVERRNQGGDRRIEEGSLVGGGREGPDEIEEV